MNNTQLPSQEIRVRFAPSPTGHLHIGGLRTALFNWLFSRHSNATFLLRIEDTDIERSKPEYTASILESLAWADITPDEPLLIQTHQIDTHKSVIQKLVQEKKAYRCVCTPQELANRCTQSIGSESIIHYDEHCRNRDDISADTPSVVRFAIPKDRTEISFDDIIRDTVTFPIDQFDDFIIARTDGTPMYNFVVVVDDAAMRISHVIRGEDHISNTPKQIMLYEACGYKVPLFAHLPMILGPNGNRLSKRDAATSVLDYKREGYLPEALINYLVRLGWAHKDQEIFTRQELIELFCLENVAKKGAIFDMQKLAWVNSVYIRAMEPQALIEYIEKHMDEDFTKTVSSWTPEQLHYAFRLYQERVKTIKELMHEVNVLHDGPEKLNEHDVNTWITHETLAYIPAIIAILEQLDVFSTDALTLAIKDHVKQLGIKMVQLLQPIRIALIGKSDGPGVFDLMAVLGKEECIKRLAALLAQVKDMLAV